MKKQIKNFIKNLFRKLYWFLKFKRNNFWSASNKKFLHSFKNVHLTSQEKKAIRELWGNIDLTYHKMMKSLCGFNPMYCSMQFYGSKILPVINPIIEGGGVKDKNLYDNYKHEILFPDTIVKNMGGIFIKDGKVITQNEAIEICLRESEFIIKPSIESGRGRNVQKMNSASYEKINDTFKLYKQDFIVQQIIKQSAMMEKLNPSSLNTIRINTLFLNGKVSVCARVLMFGVNGAIVSNTADNFRVILRENGSFYDFATDKYLKKITCMNGMNFSSMQIPNYEHVENLAKEKHIKMFPHIGIIGWDFALGIDENFVCIEMNVRFPGIYYFQFNGGPIFGDRTREIINYVNQNSAKKRVLI